MINQRQLAFEQAMSLATIVGVEEGEKIIRGLYGVSSFLEIDEKFRLSSGTKLSELTPGHDRNKVSLHHELGRLELKISSNLIVIESELSSAGTLIPPLFGHSVRDMKLELSRISVPSPCDETKKALFRSIYDGIHPLDVFADTDELAIYGNALSVGLLKAAVKARLPRCPNWNLKEISPNFWSVNGQSVTEEQLYISSKYKIFLPLSRKDIGKTNKTLLLMLSKLNAFKFSQGLNGLETEGIILAIQSNNLFWSNIF